MVRSASPQSHLQYGAQHSPRPMIRISPGTDFHPTNLSSGGSKARNETHQHIGSDSICGLGVGGVGPATTVHGIYSVDGVPQDQYGTLELV